LEIVEAVMEEGEQNIDAPRVEFVEYLDRTSWERPTAGRFTVES